MCSGTLCRIGKKLKVTDCGMTLGAGGRGEEGPEVTDLVRVTEWKASAVGLEPEEIIAASNRLNFLESRTGRWKTGLDLDNGVGVG